MLTLERQPPEYIYHGRLVFEDGEPVEGADVRASPSDPESKLWSRWDETDAEGRFSFAAPAGVPHDVTARIWNQRRFAPTTLRGVLPGSGELLITLHEAVFFELQVIDGADAPIPFHSVRVYGKRHLPEAFLDTDDPSGTTRVMLPDHAFRMVVEAKGYREVDLGWFEPEAVPREVVVRMQRLAHVAGVIEGRDGKPLSGASVRLAELSDPHETYYVYGFPARLSGFGLEGTKSDAQGRFRLPIKKRARYALYAELDGYASAELSPLELSPTGADQRHDLVLGGGGAVQGRVLVAPGQSAAGVLVRVTSGDFQVHEAVTDAAGRYRIERLAPGSYMLEATHRRRGRSPGGMVGAVESEVTEEEFEFDWAFEVFEGRTTTHDVDIADQELGTVAGSLSVDGLAHAACLVRILPGDKAWHADPPSAQEIPMSVRGTFEFEARRTGWYWLVFTPSSEPLEGTVIVRRFELEKGTTRVDVELLSASLRGRVLGADAGSFAVVSGLSPELFAITRLPRAQGSFRIASLPAGPQAKLVRRQSGAPTADPLAWRELESLPLPSGQWAEIDLE